MKEMIAVSVEHDPRGDVLSQTSVPLGNLRYPTKLSFGGCICVVPVEQHPDLHEQTCIAARRDAAIEGAIRLILAAPGVGVLAEVEQRLARVLGPPVPSAEELNAIAAEALKPPTIITDADGAFGGLLEPEPDLEKEGEAIKGILTIAKGLENGSRERVFDAAGRLLFKIDPQVESWDHMRRVATSPD